MYYYRIPFGKDWLDVKLSKEEAGKLQTLTTVKCIDALTLIEQVAAQKGVNLRPDQAQAIFNKVAPTYDSLASDYIKKNLDAKKETPAPAAAVA